ncbi:MAG: cytidine/deoxycytidylate deaminase family protein [Patescibacteria group bacterium]
MNRPSWDEYFMGLAEEIGKRGTCDRGRSGAVIVIDRQIVTTGYVGSPPGEPHCDEAGHMMHKTIDEAGNESMHCLRTIHAEENAILQAAKFGRSLVGGTLYCKMTPCYRCARMLVSVGVKRVVAKKRYHADRLSLQLFSAAGVKVEIWENKLEEYQNQ